MLQRTKRYPAKCPVILRKGPEMLSATLCNVNETGGCILGAPSLKTGDTVVMDYGTGQTRATAIWSLARMTGLKFESQLSPQKLDTIRVLTPAPRVAARKRLGLVSV